MAHNPRSLESLGRKIGHSKTTSECSPGPRIMTEPVTVKVGAGIDAQIGTTMDFGTMQFIESAATTELEDGRSVEIFRGAMNPMFFEIKIEGDDRYLRLSIEDVIRDAISVLKKEIANGTG